MPRSERIEIVVPANFTLSETIRMAARAVRDTGKALERRRTHYERHAQFRALSRLISATPTLLVYDVWLGKVESKKEKIA